MSKRYVMITNKCEVSIIDTEEENAELFGAFCEDEEGVMFLQNGLDPLVCALNEQDRLLKENNICF